MKDFSYCYRCKVEHQIDVKQCPTCGGRVVTSKRIRVLGVMLIVIGIFLTLMMGGLAVFFAGLMLHVGVPESTGNFTGTPEQAAIIFGLFGVIFAMGLTSIVGGIYQVRHGKRNVKVQIFTFILVALVIIFYWLVRAFLPHS